MQAGLGAAAFTAARTRQPAGLAKLDIRQRLIDRAAWRNLYNKKVERNDGPQGRNNQ
jgi:hypothetical protein